MIELVYSPKWFFGKDIVIDAISIAVLLLIALFSLRYYKMSGKKSYLHFFFALVLMGVSFAFKIITNFTLYYQTPVTKNLGIFILTYTAVKETHILFIVGFLMYRLLMLLGLYILYSMYIKQEGMNAFLIIYLIMVSTYFSSSAYYLFYITSLIFLAMVTIHYYQNYKKSHQSKLLLYSFGTITISQAIFVFVRLSAVLYVVAEIVQLIGYLGLFITLLQVLKYGKKTRKK